MLERAWLFEIAAHDLTTNVCQPARLFAILVARHALTGQASFNSRLATARRTLITGAPANRPLRVLSLMFPLLPAVQPRLRISKSEREPSAIGFVGRVS